MNEIFDENLPKSDYLLFPKLKNVVHRNEELLWINRPKQIPFILSGKGLELIVFGLIWITLFWWGGLGLFSLLGLLFLCAGINGYLTRVVGFPETVFGLTKSKILIRTRTWFGVALQAIELESVLDVVITVSPLEKLFKVGSVKFFIGKTEYHEDTDYKVYHCWLAIENPHQVYEAVTKMIYERKNRSNTKPKKETHNDKTSGYLLDYPQNVKQRKRRR